MSKLRLSRQVTEGFEALKDVSAQQVAELVDALNSNLKAGFQFDRDVEAVVRNVSGELDEKKLESVTRSIIALQFLRLSSGDDDESFANDLAKRIEGTNVDARRLLEQKLLFLLSVSPLRTSVKAWSLIDEFERIYAGSRIITDIRPVFEDQGTSRAVASMVTHTLRITNRLNGKNESLYLYLDDADLEELGKQVKRALEKSGVLKSIVKQLPGRELGSILGEE